MSELLRRLRGLAGVGLTWGALWAAMGAVIGVVVGVISPELWAVNPVGEWAVGMGLYGLVSGLGFGTVISLRERQKEIADLTLGRVAAWGVLGSAAVPLFFGALGMFEPGTTTIDVAQAVLVTGLLGGASAPASVALAKRAELRAAEAPRLLS